MASAIDLWHQCIENAALDSEMMTEDVVFYSPYVYTPIKGKKSLATIKLAWFLKQQSMICMLMELIF